jgi:hypothetical protein
MSYILWGLEISFLFKFYRLNLGPTQSIIQWIHMVISVRIKRAEDDTNREHTYGHRIVNSYYITN